MSILIQNGTLICPDGPVKADLRVEGDKIAEIGPALPVGDSQVIDAEGKLVFPGFIDTHTHFEMNKGTIRETADNWESGTKAALAGGTTCVLDFAEPERGASLQSALDEWHARADGHASCHYGFHMTIKDWDSHIIAEIPQMTAQGVTSYKVYLAYANIRISDGVAYEVIKAVGKEGGVVGCHCENGDLIDRAIAELKAAGKLSPASHPLSHTAVMEAEAVNRWLALAEQAGYPVNVVHLSTRRGLEAARAARKRGQKVYLESCPQYFTLTEDEILTRGALARVNPPLRTAKDIKGIIAGLKDGTIDAIATDHAPHSAEEKARPLAKAPSGMIGLETSLAIALTELYHTGRMKLPDLIRRMTYNPAAILRLGTKGRLSLGSDADIAIFDPEEEWTIDPERFASKARNTPFAGRKVKGRVKYTIVAGNIIYQDNM